MDRTHPLDCRQLYHELTQQSGSLIIKRSLREQTCQFTAGPYVVTKRRQIEELPFTVTCLLALSAAESLVVLNNTCDEDGERGSGVVKGSSVGDNEADGYMW